MNAVLHPDAAGASSEPLYPRTNDVLAEICRAIARSANHREVVQESAVRLQRYFGTHSVLILFESDGDLLVEGLAFPDHLSRLTSRTRAAWDVRPATPERPSVQAMRRRQILRWDVDDPGLDAEVVATMQRAGGRTLTAIPVYVDADPIGACVVMTPDGKPLTAADEALLETALGVVGVVYRRGVLKEIEAERQRKAIQAHNLAAVGELAAGVAHEVNNPLNTVVHFGELLLQKSLDSEAREHVSAIVAEALRAAGTVRSLQLFARSGSGDGSTSSSVGEAIRAIVDLEKHQLAVSSIDVRVEIDADLPEVRSDAAHLRRALHNVVTNARYAIQQTGAPGEIAIFASRRGRTIEIAVEDTGPGLTPEIAAAMFRPFFTTRPAGEGTGLGLAVAYGMVRENGGTIEGLNWGRPKVEGGEPGEGGARIVIQLPAAVAPWLESPGPGEETPAPARSLRILVVEDEPQVAKSVVALLARDGHGVDLTTRAEDAVERIRDDQDGYDVVLSDFRMPGMGGEGLWTWIRTERPALLDRVLFMSGDLLAPRTEAFLAASTRPVLAKPFTLAALRSALAPFAGVRDPDGGAPIPTDP